MTFENVAAIVGAVPHMPPDRGRLIYDFVRETKPEQVLELGFAHGTSACYIAAALEENGKGRILTIDSHAARQRTPDIISLLKQTNLERFVTPIFAERSYTWELMKLIERHTTNGATQPQFDFVFIDGGHTWDSDGFAFLLADRLLKPNGWVLFDDVLWTPSVMQGEPWVDAMPEEERSVAHVEKVLTLLVVPNESYHNVRYDGTWAWAQKKSTATVGDNRIDVMQGIYKRSNRARRIMAIRRYVKRLFGIR